MFRTTALDEQDIRCVETLQRKLADLRAHLHFFETLLDAIPNPIFYKDRDLVYRGCNRAFEELLGRSRAEIVGRSLHDFFPPDMAELNRRGDLATLAQGAQCYEGTLDFADGSRREVILNKGVLRRPDDSTVLGVVGMILDVSGQKQAEREIFRLANFDPVTGLPNRENFVNSLAFFQEAGRCDGLSVMALEVDNFKLLHDTLGHDFCNLLLAAVGSRLTETVGNRGVVARIGGEKFAICWQQTQDAARAGAVAKELIELIAQPFRLQEQEVHATACIGIAALQTRGEVLENLLHQAESALRQSRQAGRGTWKIFAGDASCTALARLTLEADLRRALARHEFSLAYQPQVDLLTGRIVGVEALLRWIQPQRGDVAPDDFIGLAEETGLIHDIGRWVLVTACRTARIWQEQGCAPVRIAVNVSGRQLKQPGFAELVAGILRDTGLAPHWLELELTESTIMDDTAETIRILGTLKALGVHLSIDDFGTGYSSLAYLKRFPIDKLKIDRSFIRDLPHASDDVALTEAIIAMASGLGLRVIAEGVEREEQVDFLRQRHCTLIQGYFFSRPVAAEALRSLLAKAQN